MNEAKDLFLAGQLPEAIAQLSRELQAQPTNTPARTLLFECLCFSGELERAIAQLEAIGLQSLEGEIGGQFLRQLLEVEKKRRAVAAGSARPMFLTPPPDYVSNHLKALGLIAERKPVEARALIEKALSLRPALSGTWNGIAFSDFSDADDFLAPVLEIAMVDRYIWVPYEQIRRVEFQRPKSARELLWSPANLVLRNGQTLGGIVYPLYQRTSLEGDSQVRLGRATEWVDAGAGLMAGLGLRLFLVDDEEVSILDAETIDFANEA